MTLICCRRATAARHQFSDQRRAHFHGCSDSPETPSYSAPRFACPLTHVPLDLWSRNPSPPRVSWTWMNPKRYARCTAAVVSDWSVSILPLRSIGVVGGAKRRHDGSVSGHQLPWPTGPNFPLGNDLTTHTAAGQGIAAAATRPRSGRRLPFPCFTLFVTNTTHAVIL